MPVARALVGLILCTSVALAAEAPELQPLKGEKIRGELVSVTDKEIVLKVDGKPVATSTEQTLLLEFASVANVKTAYTAVELIDGSVLRCSQIAYKGKEATLTLLTEQKVQVPLKAIVSVMRDAHDANNVAAWKELFAGKKRSYDSVVAKSETGSLREVEGTFYDASDDGKSIEFTPKGSDVRAKLQVERIHGMVFIRTPPANPPELLCKFHDTQGTVLMASSAALNKDTFTVVTQGGVKVDYPRTVVARLDYGKNKLRYLSDIELARVKVVESGALGVVFPFRRDRNIDGDPIKLGGRTYPKGLSMHAYCELTFDLEGEYREFKAVVGIDEGVTQGSDKPVIFRVEGDGKELLEMKVVKKDGAKPVTLLIRDVQKLKLVVSSEDILGLGSHLSLGDAKVSK